MKYAVILSVAAMSAGCINILSSVVTPTAVERQMLGVYDELDRDLVLVSSMRGGAYAGGPFRLEAAALRARRLQRLNQDDLVELKNLACVVERFDGTIDRHPCQLDDRRLRTRARIILQENESRRTIWVWVKAELDQRAERPVLLEELAHLHHRLMLELSAPGQVFETRAGTFDVQ